MEKLIMILLGCVIVFLSGWHIANYQRLANNERDNPCPNKILVDSLKHKIELDSCLIAGQAQAIVELAMKQNKK